MDKKGFEDGVFLVAGAILLGADGSIIAHKPPLRSFKAAVCKWEACERRISRNCAKESWWAPIIPYKLDDLILVREQLWMKTKNPQ